MAAKSGPNGGRMGPVDRRLYAAFTDVGCFWLNCRGSRDILLVIPSLFLASDLSLN